jgi:hypothetical protein
MQPDPAQHVGGLNLYAAFYNNPVNYSDSMGLCPPFSLTPSLDSLLDPDNPDLLFDIAYMMGQPSDSLNPYNQNLQNQFDINNPNNIMNQPFPNTLLNDYQNSSSLEQTINNIANKVKQDTSVNFGPIAGTTVNAGLTKGTGFPGFNTGPGVQLTITLPNTNMTFQIGAGTKKGGSVGGTFNWKF